MALKLYNSLTRSVEPFVPLDPSGTHVGLYTCGPTVYNYAHIGNFRAYIFGDIVKRVLAYNGYEVNHIMNLTDVDDKTIRDSQKEGKTLNDFTEHYSAEFKKDLTALNIQFPNTFTRAVDHIPGMIRLTETLLEKGFAYTTDDGSVYFNVRKDKEYGQLSPIALSEQKENAAGRLNKADDYDKEHAEDFALWKAWDAADGDVFWIPSNLVAGSTLAKGRPGWHIECSAMSMEYLGETFDIHTGGIDLVFPHHENEIAQSECATGKTFVNYWLHNEWVMVDGKKMSKSLGNFHTLRSLIDQGVDPIAFRLWVISGHHRTQINFTMEAVQGTHTALQRLRSHFLSLGDEIGVADVSYTDRFKDVISEDLDTPPAVALMWEVVKDQALGTADKRATLLDFDRVLGLGLADLKKIEIPQEIQQLVDEREQARKSKDFALSDKLRADIESQGYIVKDTADGPVVEKI